MRTAIVLFTRDLRVHDNPALAVAAREAERIVPLFVFDEAILESAFARPNRVAFLLDALRDLDASLTARGARLVLRSGDLVAETLALARGVGASAVFVAEDASGYAQRRQRRLEEACRGDRTALRVTTGVTVAPLSSIETSAGSHYSVFTPFYRAWSKAPRRPVESAPRRLSMPTGLSRGRMPTLSRLVDGSPSPELPPGGETHGRQRLSAWLRAGIAGYDANHDTLAADATSRLSPYIHFGCLSPLEVACEPERLPAGRPSSASSPGATSSTSCSPRDPRRRTKTCVPAAIAGAATATRSRRGRTARPAIRSSMPACGNCSREGYMHNRARLITASFLVRDLRVDWRAGARHYFDWLVDGDVANNVGNWQWVAGTGANPRPNRAFNPLRQAHRFDPDGAYVRRYVNELAAIEGSAVHEPWKLRENVPGYPTPIVDPT